jgi:drug/metabolite transporter (DMT)-like permease
MSVLWGIPYLLIRVAVRHVDPSMIVFGRTSVAALTLAPLVTLKRQWGVFWHNFGWICAFGFIEFGLAWFLMSVAEQHITSSLTSLLICSVPLLALLLHRLNGDHEKIHGLRLIGLVVGALGVLGLVGLNLGHGEGKWLLVMLGVCVGYTVGPYIMATKLSHVPGYVIVAGSTGAVAVAWSPVAIVQWPHHFVAASLWSIIVLGIFSTAAAFLAFNELVKEAGSNRPMVVTYVNTAIAVMLGVVILHEPLTTGIIVGFPLVLVGSVLATSAPASVKGRDDANLAVNE